MNLKKWQSLSEFFQGEILERNKKELDFLKYSKELLQEEKRDNVRQIIEKHIKMSKERMKENRSLGQD